ncbi:hypothetical protein K432DRAFT_384318 [Lepidopterella palustris CBS 459.81]|uniref:LIM zinc-binding domain-containing protein n=1 Tax=Lepidopterella palustris CBS 459.81 TaxID=1314670 RepID=A0A8E2JCY9_9PEZI|nr:hypothetical protein K432DRAFT_384318 [Lepidopterella palustris CBS 459.81]
MHRSKSKDRVTTPGPAFMSSKQMANYLHDLRNNRIPRPNGSRPPPIQFASMSRAASRVVETPAISPLSHPSFNDAVTDSMTALPRCSSAQSHHRTNSARSNKNVVESMVGRPLIPDPRPRDVSTFTTDSGRPPSIIYRENGQRLVEREEAKALRRALEDIDLQEEHGLYSAARDEAAELVWKHQNPGVSYPNPDAPYQYPALPRKDSHQRSQSLGRASQDLQRSNSKLRKRNSYSSASASGGSRSSSLQSNRVPSDSSMKNLDTTESSADSTRGRQPREAAEIWPKIPNASAFPLGDPKQRRRSSGPKRNPSGSLFRNPDDQIYEEPEEETPPPPKPILAKTPTTLPLQVRRNPFTRVQFAKEDLMRSNTDPAMGTKKFDKYEIHNNPPTRSRNALYISNSLPATPPKPKEENNEGRGTEFEIKMKDGKEIRGDDIRAATSMRLKDRSPRLPTPTVVSDSPGRPIVSFQKGWKPKEVELQQEQSRSLPPIVAETTTQSEPTPRPLSKAATAPVVPTINFPDNPLRRTQEPSRTVIPKINISQTAPIPSISINSAPPPPTINIHEAPSIAVSSPSIPSINITTTPIPTINAPSARSQPPTRPLPTPTAKSHRPLPRSGATAPPTSTPHWTPSTRRISALCAQCALPIAGRIVSAAGSRFHPECFVCHHCGEGLECVAFYPEPENKRAERVDRILRRMKGEDIEIGEGISEAEDGDESMRFYCHLDYHEFFSPRCKSCKTPIEGEVIVACGAEWHAGHFFCAQCGDPFDSNTPFVEKDGYAWCVNCHTNRYSTKCKKCRKPVTDTVVKALGAEWHAQCFCCVECGGQFDDGRYFLRGNSQDPVCVKCEERRLKA